MILAVIVGELRKLFLARRETMKLRVSGTAIRGMDLSIVVLSANGLTTAEIQIISARRLVTFKIWNLHIAHSRQMWSRTALVARLRCRSYWTNLERIARLLFPTVRRNARKSLHVDICARNLATRASADHV